MKIKTIIQYDPNIFDDHVNQLLEEGYILGKRDFTPPDAHGQVAHYAQLVLLDPAPEPETIDPLDLLRQLKTFCDNTPDVECRAGKCPLAPYCDAMLAGKAIDEWELPEEVPNG